MQRFAPLIIAASFASPLMAQTQEERDVGFIQGLIEDNLSDVSRTVRIEGFAGALSSRASIDSMTIADADGIWFRAEGLVLDWNRSALVRGRIEISEMSADLIELVRPPVSEEDAPSPEATPFEFALPELPVSIEIDQIEATRIVLGQPLLGTEYAFGLDGTVALSGGEGSAQIVATRQDGAEGRFEISGAYSNATEVLALTLDLTEEPGGIVGTALDLPDDPSVRLTLAGEAPISEYDADLTIATAGIERIAGTFGLRQPDDGGQEIVLDIAGDVNALIETDYADFFGDDVRLAVQGARSPAGALTLSQLALDARAIELAGSASLAPDGWPRTLDLQGRIADDDGTAVILPTADGTTRVDEVVLDITFDAAEGDVWTADFVVTNLDRPDLNVPQLTLDGGGLLRRTVGDSPGRVTGNLDYAAQSLRLADPALAEAIGADITGVLQFAQDANGPFDISALTLRGPGIEIDADAEIAVGDIVTVQTSADIRADDLARFGALAGLPDLGGQAAFNAVGDLRPLDGIFDITIDGETRDLALGIAQADPLLAGDGTLALRAVRDTQGTRVERFDVATDEIQATGRADITSGTSTANFDLTIPDVSVAIPELAGSANLRGTVDTAEDQSAIINVTADLPTATAQITARIAPPEQDRETTFTVNANARDLAPYADFVGQDIAGAFAFEADGTTLLDGSLFEVTINGTTNDLAVGIPQADTLLRGDGTLSVEARRNGPDSFTLTALGVETAQVALEADAIFEMGVGTANVDATLTNLNDVIPDVRGPATAVGVVRRDNAALVDLDLTLRAPGQTEARLRAAIDTNDPAYPADADLSAQVGDISAFAAVVGQQIAGAVTADITTSIASLTDPAAGEINANFDITANDLGLDQRRLPGALALTGMVARQTDGTLITATQGTTPGDGAITLDGSLSPEGRATGRLQADLADLQPFSSFAGRALAGKMSALVDGGAQIDFSTFDIALDVNGTDLSAGGVALTGGIDVAGTAARDTAGAITLDVAGQAPGQSQFALTAAGTDTLDADLAVNIGTLSAYSGLIGQSLSGGLSADIAGTMAADFSSFDLAASGRATGLNPGIPQVATLLRGTGTFDGRFMQAADGTLAIDGLDVAFPNITVTGDLSSRDGGGTGTFNARLADIGLFTDALSGPITAAGTAQVLQSGDYSVDIDANGPGGIEASVAGLIGGGGSLALDIIGTAPLALANPFIEPRRISGQSQFDLQINGPPALSSVSGDLSFANGRLAAPSFSQALEGLRGQVSLAQSTANLDVSGQLEDGGDITLAGSIGLTGALNADLQLTAQTLVLRDPTLYETTADARLTVTGPLTGGAQIAGQIDIGPAEIQVPSSTTSALGSLPTVRHLNAPSGVQQTLSRAGLTTSGGEAASAGSNGPGFGLDILINAPARIFVRGRGLDAELGGSLQISGTTNQIIPIGQFELIRGRIDILQQRFELDEGAAFLQGDFVPALRLVATTETSDSTVVRIIVEGPATEPEVRFESSPDLPQDEVLARLIFGRDLSSISPLQAVQLAGAVSTLVGGGGGGLLDSFRQGVGLDDLDITSDDAGNPAVRAGAYVSENIYTTVTVGSETAEINLNLDVTDEITVTGTTSSDGNTGIGVFFERDY